MDYSKIIQYEMSDKEKIKAFSADIILKTYQKYCELNIPYDVVIGYDKSTYINAYTKYINEVGYISIIVKRDSELNIKISIAVRNINEYLLTAWKNIFEDYDTQISHITFDDLRNKVLEHLADNVFDDISYGITLESKHMPTSIYSSVGDVDREKILKAKKLGFEYYDRGVWMIDM